MAVAAAAVAAAQEDVLNGGGARGAGGSAAGAGAGAEARAAGAATTGGTGAAVRWPTGCAGAGAAAVAGAGAERVQLRRAAASKPASGGATADTNPEAAGSTGGGDASGSRSGFRMTEGTVMQSGRVRSGRVWTAVEREARRVVLVSGGPCGNQGRQWQTMTS